MSNDNFQDKKEYNCSIPGCENKAAGWIAIRKIGLKNYCERHWYVLMNQPDADSHIINSGLDGSGRQPRGKKEYDE